MVIGGVEMKEKKEINIEVGQNIQRAREKAGFTQDQLSELIGIGPKSLSSAERGLVGISITTLRRICTVLSISADSIIFGETELGDTSQISERLVRLSPQQFEIAKAIIAQLLAAFSLDLT